VRNKICAGKQVALKACHAVTRRHMRAAASQAPGPPSEVTMPIMQALPLLLLTLGPSRKRLSHTRSAVSGGRLVENSVRNLAKMSKASRHAQ
jgi:hypothetical protein